MITACSSGRIFAALGLELALVTAVTRAQPGFAFSWQAPPQCPTRARAKATGSNAHPKPALGFGGALSARLAAWSLGAHAIWLPPQRAELSGAAQAVELEHWSVGLRPCRELLGPVWALEACAAADIGRLHAQGIGLREARAVNNH